MLVVVERAGRDWRLGSVGIGDRRGLVEVDSDVFESGAEWWGS